MGKRDGPPRKGSMSQNHCPSELGGTASFSYQEERKQAPRRGVICPELHNQEQKLALSKGQALPHA